MILLLPTVAILAKPQKGGRYEKKGGNFDI